MWSQSGRGKVFYSLSPPTIKKLSTPLTGEGSLILDEVKVQYNVYTRIVYTMHVKL